MTASYTKSQKYCSTCEFWDGERETNTPRTYAVLPEGGSTKGKCIEKRITTVGFSNSGCNKWVVWGRLK